MWKSTDFDLRQAARRAWHIGQPRECYVYYLYYKDTMQHRAMHLMSKKMAAACLEVEFSEGRAGGHGGRRQHANGPGKVDGRED